MQSTGRDSSDCNTLRFRLAVRSRSLLDLLTRVRPRRSSHTSDRSPVVEDAPTPYLAPSSETVPTIYERPTTDRLDTTRLLPVPIPTLTLVSPCESVDNEAFPLLRRGPPSARSSGGSPSTPTAELTVTRSESWISRSSSDGATLYPRLDDNREQIFLEATLSIGDIHTSTGSSHRPLGAEFSITRDNLPPTFASTCSRSPAIQVDDAGDNPAGDFVTSGLFFDSLDNNYPLVDSGFGEFSQSWSPILRSINETLNSERDLFDTDVCHEEFIPAPGAQAVEDSSPNEGSSHSPTVVLEPLNAIKASPHGGILTIYPMTDDLISYWDHQNKKLHTKVPRYPSEMFHCVKTKQMKHRWKRLVFDKQTYVEVRLGGKVVLPSDGGEEWFKGQLLHIGNCQNPSFKFLSEDFTTNDPNNPPMLAGDPFVARPIRARKHIATSRCPAHDQQESLIELCRLQVELVNSRSRSKTTKRSSKIRSRTSKSRVRA
ncbi:hypothetical protein BT69DRAFT_1345621 [Atractiella rhizophila]|nr:hypothetical protein BT69DRAFT_1345621 [Atractiella rhizophila]